MDNGKMLNAPVYYALAQVHFNPIVAMAHYVDRVQDTLRREGYTLFEPQQITHLKLEIAANGQSVPNLSTDTNWWISRSDRRAGFILTQSTMTFHTTNYETHNEFLPDLLSGLKAVDDAVNLDHISRIGLRYLDAILPKTGETVEMYLDDGLKGVSFDGQRQFALSESMFEIATGPLVPSGTLVMKVYKTPGSLGLPPDIPLHGLELMPRFSDVPAMQHAIIDIDHFVSGTMPLDLEKVAEQLKNLHGTIRKIFESTTTNHARTVWA